MSVQARGNRGERKRRELWQASVRAYHARRAAEMRELWRTYHQDQAARHRATLEALATYHECEAAKLLLEDTVVDGEGG